MSFPVWPVLAVLDVVYSACQALRWAAQPRHAQPLLMILLLFGAATPAAPRGIVDLSGEVRASLAFKLNYLKRLWERRMQGQTPGSLPITGLPNTDDLRKQKPAPPVAPPPIPSTQPRWRPPKPRSKALLNPPRLSDSRKQWLARFDVGRGLGTDFGRNAATSRLVSRTSRPSEDGLVSDSPDTLFPADSSSGPRLRPPSNLDSSTTTDVSAAAAMPPPQSGSPDFYAARLDPNNRTGDPGEDLLSGNYNWTLPFLSLRGRAGLDLGLALAYNSRVWVRSGNYIGFDWDEGFPTAGFRLGFPVIDGGASYNSQAGAWYYLLITPSGQHLELRSVNNSNTLPKMYESVDSSYLQLTDFGSYLVLMSDGAQLTFNYVYGQNRVVEAKDANGNKMSFCQMLCMTQAAIL
jgi:hypothetical protein